MSMNYFFAIELSPEARQTVQKLAEEWRTLLDIRSVWYGPDDYHITLKFLGSLDEAELLRLIEAAGPIAAATQPFAIRSATAGGFPNMRAPSVLWMGVNISAGLDILAAHLDHTMAGLGFRLERRRYQPHITIARCRLRTMHYDKTQNGLIPIDWPLPGERLFEEFTADRFVLMQTLPPQQRAKEGKTRYNIVQTFPFGDAHSSDLL